MLLEEGFLPIVLARLKNSAAVCNSDKILTTLRSLIQGEALIKGEAGIFLQI